MKVIIRDAQTLLAISPKQLTGYLRSLGWQEVEKISDKASVWAVDKGVGKNYEVLVPLNTGLGDYAARIADVLTTLEVFNEQTQLQIVSDINNFSVDVVRVRAPDADNGTIPFKGGIEMFVHSYGMLLAAASSAVVARPVYFSNKSIEALNYLEHVRLGQTEKGSFVLTLLSPVPSNGNLSDAKNQDGENTTEPFERRVTRVLAESLQSVNAVSSSVIAGSNYNSFKKVVENGVSSNLCEALVGIVRSVEGSSVDISFSWSSNYIAPKNVSSRITVPRNIVPVLEQAADLLKRDAEPDDSEIQGYVVKLARPQPKARGGEIVISGIAEGVARQARVKLSHEDYQRAVTAHEKYESVVCFGQLIRQGNAYQLKNPHGFAITEFFDAGAKSVSAKKSAKTEGPQNLLF